jgi:hypothetical protein
MKPTCQRGPLARLRAAEFRGEDRQSPPQTDYFFQSGIGEWRGYSSSYDGDDRSESRNFHNLSREFLIEAARERMKEMIVLGLVGATSAWPVIYMVVTVVKLLSRGRPLT